MSARPLTTFDRLPSDIIQETLRCLDGDALREYGASSRKSRARVHECYQQGCQNCSQVMDAYKASQGSQEDLSIRARANSLIRKTEKLVGGPGLLKDIGNPLALDGQKKLADARFSCKVIGLLPFFQAMPEAAEVLGQVKALRTSREKYKTMRQWLAEHPDAAARIERIEAIRVMYRNMREFVAPSFFAIPGKVYNLVPKEVAYFTGLKKWDLTNNLLSELPEEIAELPIEELSISLNFFKTMPPVIPTLRVLKMTGSYNEVSADSLIQYVRSWVAAGGKNLTIHLDDTYFDGLRVFDVGNDHTVQISKDRGDTVIQVAALAEPTQVLSDTEYLD